MGSEDLAARVRGQVSDLEAEVIWRKEVLSGAWDAQVAEAARVALRERADLVVWLAESRTLESSETSAARTQVAVLLVAAERLYARDVGPALSESDRDERSATLEIAALAVRAATRALSAADAIGEPVAIVKPEPAATVAPQRKPEPVPEAEPQGDPREPLEGVFGVGTAVHGDGHSDFDLSSVSLLGGLRQGRFRWLLDGQWGLARTIQAPGAELQLRRFGVQLESHVALLDPQRAPLFLPQLVLRVGGVGLRRSTRATSSDVTATTPNTAFSALFGLGASLEWGPFRGAPEHHFALGGGADFVPQAPLIELLAEDGGNNNRRYALSVLQPFVNLRWLVTWR
jgi:hypothetical protein